MRAIFNMAEREGFEPSVRLNTVHSLSRRAHSTTLAPLQIWMFVFAGRAVILWDVVSFGNVVRCVRKPALAEYRLVREAINK